MQPSRSAALPAACLPVACILCACLLWGCASKRGTPDNEPTLKTLASRSVVVEKDGPVVATETQAIDAYKKFLDVALRAPQRAEAMRRIGDLEMDRADKRSASADTSLNTATHTDADPDYRSPLSDTGNPNALSTTSCSTSRSPLPPCPAVLTIDLSAFTSTITSLSMASSGTRTKFLWQLT